MPINSIASLSQGPFLGNIGYHGMTESLENRLAGRSVNILRVIRLPFHQDVNRIMVVWRTGDHNIAYAESFSDEPRSLRD